MVSICSFGLPLRKPFLAYLFKSSDNYYTLMVTLYVCYMNGLTVEARVTARSSSDKNEWTSYRLCWTHRVVRKVPSVTNCCDMDSKCHATELESLQSIHKNGQIGCLSVYHQNKNVPNIFASSKSATWTWFAIVYRQKTVSMSISKSIELHSFFSCCSSSPVHDWSLWYSTPWRVSCVRKYFISPIPTFRLVFPLFILPRQRQTRSVTVIYTSPPSHCK